MCIPPLIDKGKKDHIPTCHGTVAATMDHAMPHLSQPTYSSAAELHEANMECQSCNNRGAEANAKENNLRCSHKEYQTNAVR
jgi:hypothetical protein